MMNRFISLQDLSEFRSNIELITIFHILFQNQIMFIQNELPLNLKTMGNICTQEKVNIVSQFQNGNVSEKAISNLYSINKKKHQPSYDYATLANKCPILVKAIQQVLSRQLHQKPIKNAFQRGVQFPTYLLKVSIIKNSDMIEKYQSCKTQERQNNITSQDYSKQSLLISNSPQNFKEKSQILYNGEWLKGRPHGNGKLYINNKQYFEGGFKEGQIQCEDGIIIYGDCSFYRGNFAKNMFQGYGVFSYSQTGMRYEGNWENNKPHGYGIQKFKDGSYYQGQFKNGLKNGRGNFYWSDGKKYIGEFKDGYIHGKGLLTKGKGIYEGIFKMNMKEGKGKLRTQYGQYYGTFVNGEMEGQGRFVWDDGKVYYGEFKQNKMHGKGIINYPTGQKIEGVWEKGQNVAVENILKKNK